MVHRTLPLGPPVERGALTGVPVVLVGDDVVQGLADDFGIVLVGGGRKQLVADLPQHPVDLEDERRVEMLVRLRALAVNVELVELLESETVV